jgi:hypothetical protein
LKKIIAAALVASAALTLTACGQSEEEKKAAVMRDITEKATVSILRGGHTDFVSMSDADILDLARKGCDLLKSGKEPNDVVDGLDAQSDKADRNQAFLILVGGSSMLCEEHKVTADDIDL